MDILVAYLIYLPLVWATVFASPIVALIAWGDFLNELRKESPYLFAPLLIGLSVFVIVLCLSLIALFVSRNYEYFNYFPIAGLILGFLHINRLILAWFRTSPIKILGLINGLMMFLCIVLWFNLREFGFNTAPKELFFPLASFSLLMACFWLYFPKEFSILPSKKAKEKSPHTREILIVVGIFTSLCAFVTYVAYSLPVSDS